MAIKDGFDYMDVHQFCVRLLSSMTLYSLDMGVIKVPRMLCFVFLILLFLTPRKFSFKILTKQNGQHQFSLHKFAGHMWNSYFMPHILFLFLCRTLYDVFFQYTILCSLICRLWSRDLQRGQQDLYWFCLFGWSMCWGMPQGGIYWWKVFPNLLETHCTAMYVQERVLNKNMLQLPHDAWCKK